MVRITAKMPKQKLSNANRGLIATSPVGVPARSTKVMVPSAAPHMNPIRAENECEAASISPWLSAMPSRAVFPVIADVKTSPSVRKVATSVTPDAKARAVNAKSRIAMRSLRISSSAIPNLRTLADGSIVEAARHPAPSAADRRSGARQPNRRSSEPRAAAAGKQEHQQDLVFCGFERVEARQDLPRHDAGQRDDSRRRHLI